MTAPFPAMLFAGETGRRTWHGGSVRTVSRDERFLIISDSSTEGVSKEVAYLDAIQAIVGPYGQALVDLYFRIVHPSFPVLHKKVFYEKYSKSHREFSPPLLAGLYIHALQWWEYGRDLPTSSKPDASKLRAIATESLQGVLLRPKLSTVQACLLLAHSPGAMSPALHAQTLAAAHDTGLQLDCSNWSIPTWEKGVRKRLAWAVYGQDKWGALVTGRPSLIHAADWTVCPLTDADFPERADDEDEEDGSAEVEQGRELCKEFATLSCLLSDILHRFYSARARLSLASEPPGTLIEAFTNLLYKLRSWYSKLSESLSLGNLQARKLCSVGYLHLAYWAAQVTLHRALLQVAPQVGLSGEASWQQFRQSALATFDSATAMVNALRQEHLQSFWYFASSQNLALIGAFGCELWASASCDEERLVVKKALNDYKWALRISAKAADFMRPSVEAVGVMLQALEETEADRNARSRETASDGPQWSAADEVTAYEDASSLPTFSPLGFDMDLLSSHHSYSGIFDADFNFHNDTRGDIVAK